VQRSGEIVRNRLKGATLTFGGCLLVLALASVVLDAPCAAENGATAGEPPGWAFPLNRNGPPKRAADDGTMRHVPDSMVALPAKAMADRYTAVDWHPERHPSMPDSVAYGRKPEVFACAFCHYPNGQGRPENASLAGLSSAYIVEQVHAMRDGRRRSSQPAMLSQPLMAQVAVHARDEEVAAAAAYFAALRYQPWIRVVETDTVPKTEVAGVSMLGVVADGGTEPIGPRIIEVPENLGLTELRDDASGFVAYVPPGSIRSGNELVHSAKGARAPCATCHGAEFKGTDVAPALAGRSPSYLFRQLYDIRQGVRSGAAVAPMKAEVAQMSDAEMLEVVAYLASLQP